jgi:hypothetical protein
VPKAAIFDLDGTLIDSMDLHAVAWHESLVKFGQDVSFERVRGQIGKGGESSFPFSCPRTNNETTARKWRSGAANAPRPNICRLCVPSRQSPIYCDACAMLDFGRHRFLGQIGMNSKSTSTSRASPAWWTERLVPMTSRNRSPRRTSTRSFLKSSGSKAPPPLRCDTPYDAAAAQKAGIATIGVLSGGFKRARYGKPDAPRYIPDRPRCSLASQTPRLQARQIAGLHMRVWRVVQRSI